MVETTYTIKIQTLTAARNGGTESSSPDPSQRVRLSHQYQMLGTAGAGA
jgi:hypothetical protein